MKYRVYTKRLYYELELYGKYNILTGDSGKGKSVLYSLISDRENGDHSVHLEEYSKGVWRPCSLQFAAVQRNDAELKLQQGIVGAVLVVDEDAAVYKKENVAAIFRKSNNQFLLITRKNLDFLPVSVENIYNLECIGKRHFFRHAYRVKY